MATGNNPQYFSNISDAVIVNASVTHVSGNVYNLNSELERHGSKLLLENISPGAFHDAAERGDPPRCHPHTRTAIRAEIMEWIQATDAMRKLILWMYGPAGAGKTAIAQSVAKECEKQGLLAASFFFGRTAAGRNDTTRFVATIAYQLSQAIPEISEHLISAIENDKTIFSRTLATQMRVLIIEPFKSIPPLSRPVFVITDGVDECGPKRNSHTTLLNALATAILELRDIPLIFLIVSRPEYEIREAFNGNCLSSLVKSLVLDNTYNPDDDIRLYLNSKFQEIHDKHLRLGSSLPSAWPPETDIDRLVSKASGQFIFASTVIKFIDTSRHHPQARLDIILGLSAPGNETPFALLDALYHFILSSVADLPKVLEILTLIILGDVTPLIWTSSTIKAFLGFDIHPVLVDMHALVYVPSGNYSKLRIYHASLYDFLTDRSRSHDHYIDITQGHIDLCRHWLKIMADYPNLPAPLSLSKCVNSFVRHCEKITTTNSELVDDLASFSLKKLLDKIHGHGDLYPPQWNDFFECIKKQACAGANMFPRLRDEFDAFVFKRLSQYPPALRTLIPVLFTSHEMDNWIQNVFRVCFYAMNPSEVDIDDGLRLDLTSLDLFNITDAHPSFGNGFSELFQDRSRAGRLFVNNKSSRTTLAKQIIKAIYPMPGKDKHQVKFVELEYGCQRVFNSYNPHPTIDIPFPKIVDFLTRTLKYSTSPDLELAVLLREHTLQYNDNVFAIEQHFLAHYSLEYIKDCGLQCLKHTHRPNTNACILCETYYEASRVSFFGSIILKISNLDRLAFLTRRRYRGIRWYLTET